MNYLPQDVPSCEQVYQQLEIRDQQFRIVEALLENLHDAGTIPAFCGHERQEPTGSPHRGAIVQLNMGEGKTRVILPMLVLALSRAAAPSGNKRNIVRLNFLNALLQDAVAYLRQCLTGAFQSVRTLKSFERLLWELCRISRGFLCKGVSPNMQGSQTGKYIDVLAYQSRSIAHWLGQ
jgi:hypothetical protein